MTEKIKNYLKLKLKNKEDFEIHFTYLGIILFSLMFFGFFDALSTDLVLSNGGIELNSLVLDIYKRSVFFFYYVKVIAFPLFYLTFVILLSELHFFIFKDDLQSDNFILISVIFSNVFLFLAIINNFIIYFTN